VTNGDALRVLMPRASAGRMTRRRFLGLGAAGAAAVALGVSGCDSGKPSGARRGPTGTKLEDSLNIFSWTGPYQDPKTVEAFSKRHGIEVKVDAYGSNEEALAKLGLAGGSGYDVVVPSGAYVPMFVSEGLLQPLDKSKIPNLANVDPRYLDQVWDPGNKYSVIKDWGSTGYVYDARAVRGQPQGWAGFFDVASQPRVSGKVSVLEVPADLVGLVFWRDDIDWHTTKQADLDYAQRMLLGELAPHISAFDSYPGTAMLEGAYVLSQAWNGDVRPVVIEDPERYKWVLGGPKTELWIDTWAVLANAQHPEAAHAWINGILDPKVSAREMDFHGYNTGVKGVADYLPKDTKARDIIFFTPEQLSRVVPLEVTDAFERTAAIYNTVRAAAGA